MEEEKPLHVRVAEALGWTGVYEVPGQPGRWVGHGEDHCPRCEEPDDVSRYDTNWPATGPLIEKYKLDLWHAPENILGPLEWRATCERADGSEHGETPLIAVCNLILALKEAGKL